MKRNQRKHLISGEVKTSAVAPVVDVAQKVEALQNRKVEIQARLGVINAEAAKLSAEQHGIDLELKDLAREFDRHAAV